MSKVTDADRWNTLCELFSREDYRLYKYKPDEKEFIPLSAEDAMDIPDRILAGDFEMNVLEESYR